MGHLDFQAALRKLQRTKRFLTVAHLSDVHYPDHDPKALQLAYQVIKEIQPDLIAVGSDGADFPTLSKFAPNPDEVERGRDVLKAYKGFHMEHAAKVHDAAPNAELFYIMGNHCVRIYNFVFEHAPKLRDTIEEAWIGAVRAGGLVHWLGNVSGVRIANALIVKHGERTGVNAAKNMLIDRGGQISIMGGHVHHFSKYTITGEFKTVTAVTGGCLCNLRPSYLKVKGQQPLCDWQQGSTYAVVDTVKDNVWFTDCVFLPNKKGLYTMLDRQILTI